MNRKRITTIIIYLAVVVLAAAGSWIAGLSIQSPADAAARTAPPTPSAILVPVENRILSSTIVARGTARFGLPQPIAIAPSVLKPVPGVVTTLPLLNTQMADGAVLLTASGRPVFLLQGTTPAYRDLGPGMKGADVRQIEEALARLGLNPGPVDGVYDAQTSAAVAEWYTAASFEPFGSTPDELAHIHLLATDLAVANEESLAATDAASATPLAVKAAQASADSANQMAAADLAAKIVARDRVLADASASGTTRDGSNGDVAAAQAAVLSAQLNGEISVQTALDAQLAAERRTKRLQSVADQAAAALQSAQDKAGVRVPVDEIVFVPTVPVRVQELKATVGSPAVGVMLTVTDNQLVVDSSLPIDQAPLLQAGILVTIDEPDLGIKATGVVAFVASTPGTNGVDGYHVYMEIAVDSTPFSLAGTSLRLTIPIQSTGGEVLAVPISALYLAADGTSRVQVDNNGTLTFVQVEPGLAADGYVEVTPVGDTLTVGQSVLIGYQTK